MSVPLCIGSESDREWNFVVSLGVDQGPPCPICASEEFKRLALVPSEKEAEPWRIVKCTHCDLVRTLPVPSPVELKRLYDAPYFEHLLRDAGSTGREKERFRRLFGLVRKHVAPGRLLSVGCGLGFDVSVANELGFDAEGLEPSRAAVDHARKVLGVPILEGTLETFDGEDGSYDVVTFWDVLEHVPHPESLLGRAAALLRPGGMIVVRAPNVRGLFPRISFALMPLVGEWRHPAPPAHLYDFSPRSIELLARGCGLGVRAVLDDEWPVDKLIAISRRPNITRLLATILYPAARRLRLGNCMIVILEKPPAREGTEPRFGAGRERPRGSLRGQPMRPEIPELGPHAAMPSRSPGEPRLVPLGDGSGPTSLEVSRRGRGIG